MKPARRAATMLSLIALLGCGSDAASVASLAGCYSIDVGDFLPAGLVSPSQKPPVMVQLDTTRKDFLFDNDLDHRTIVQTGEAGDFFFTRDAAWILQRDTLRLIWSSAFTGAEIRVPARRSPLRGRFEFFSYEVGTPVPSASVTLVRRPCG